MGIKNSVLLIKFTKTYNYKIAQKAPIITIKATNKTMSYLKNLDNLPYPKFYHYMLSGRIAFFGFGQLELISFILIFEALF